MTVAALSGLEGVAPQLAAHKQGAVNMGNSQELVDELCAWLDSEGYTLRSKWPKGEPNPYGKYFIGQSYLADVGGGVINVTFEPRCSSLAAVTTGISTTKQYKYSSVSVVVAGIRNGARLPLR